MSLVNGCWFRATSSGSGSFAVASAITGYMVPDDADAVDGAIYSYRASSDDDSEWEIGTGVYTASGATLSRTVLKSSNSHSVVSFSAAPRVALTALAADLTGGGGSTTETITTGASPVAANPDANVTFITTGGTAAQETVTLGDASAAIRKTFVIVFTVPQDEVLIEVANKAFFTSPIVFQCPASTGVGSVELIWSPSAGYWQSPSTVLVGVRDIRGYDGTGLFIHAGNPTEDDNEGKNVDLVASAGGNAEDDDGGDGGGIDMQGAAGGSVTSGDGDGGAGGYFFIRTTHGGSVEDGEGDGGRGGDIVLNVEGATGGLGGGGGSNGRNGVIMMQGLPTSDPGIPNALYIEAGTIKISL